MLILQTIIERIIDFLTWTGITPKEIVDSLIIYALVRTFYKGLKAANSEAGQIIRTHHKYSHRSPVRGCREGNCIRLSARLDQAQEQPQVVVLPNQL